MHPESVVIYERVLKGEYWPKQYVGTPTTINRSIEILRFLFFEKLKLCDYQSARAALNRDFVAKYRLFQVIKGIPKPPELLPDEYDHVLWLLFPEHRKGRYALVLKVYSEVLSGKRNRFPRLYFSDPAEGKYRADVCFRHLCRRVLHMSGDRIAWEFSHSEGIHLLAKYKLRIILNTVYFSLSELIYSVYPQLYPKLMQYQKERDHRIAKKRRERY